MKKFKFTKDELIRLLDIVLTDAHYINSNEGTLSKRRRLDHIVSNLIELKVQGTL